MRNNLSALEEFDAIMEIQSPYFLRNNDSLNSKQRIAYSILKRKPEEILLLNDSAFCLDSVFAGITERQIEYFAKKAPVNYRESIMKIFEENGDLDGAWEIVKSMDKEGSLNSNSNQKRFKKVVQYIRDNYAVFKL